MEQETVLKEILHALKVHSKQIEKRFDEMNSKIDNSIFDLESKMNNRFDRLEKKVDGIRVELTETQETTDY
ncbi:hypothetical protein ACDI16_15125, partial [Oceanobacillus caeni]